MKKIILHFFIYLLLINIANAQVIINEIMYDLQGSDTGREWIEVWNKGNDEIDISGWKLFEAKTNHKINLVNENDNFNIPSKSYAVIVDNFDKFNIDNPNFLGLIFDSSFSLSKKGETLILKDDNLNEIDSVNYNTDLGARGDGNSLQLIDGNWISRGSTPGKVNTLSSQKQTNNNDIVSNNKLSNFSLEVEEILMKSKIYVDVGSDRSVIVGADTLFRGNAFGLEKEPLKNARYIWSFGDGSTGEGETVLHNYQYPGDYVVVVNVVSGEYSASDRFIVKAKSADILISVADEKSNYIELYNKSNYELNLSWWRIRSGENYFTLPKNTIILANKKLILPFSVTDLNIVDKTKIYLLYPNGIIVNKYTPFIIPTNSEVEPPSTSGVVKTIPSIDELPDKDSIDIKDDNQTALMVDSLGKSKDLDLFNKWTFSLAGLILLSIMGVLVASKNSDHNEELSGEEELKPEDFNIL